MVRAEQKARLESHYFALTELFKFLLCVRSFVVLTVYACCYALICVSFAVKPLQMGLSRWRCSADKSMDIEFRVFRSKFVTLLPLSSAGKVQIEAFKMVLVSLISFFSCWTEGRLDVAVKGETNMKRFSKVWGHMNRAWTHIKVISPNILWLLGLVTEDHSTRVTLFPSYYSKLLCDPSCLVDRNMVILEVLMHEFMQTHCCSLLRFDAEASIQFGSYLLYDMSTQLTLTNTNAPGSHIPLKGLITQLHAIDNHMLTTADVFCTTKCTCDPESQTQYESVWLLSVVGAHPFRSFLSRLCQSPEGQLFLYFMVRAYYCPYINFHFADVTSVTHTHTPHLNRFESCHLYSLLLKPLIISSQISLITNSALGLPHDCALVLQSGASFLTNNLWLTTI